MSSRTLCPAGDASRDRILDDLPDVNLLGNGFDDPGSGLQASKVHNGELKYRVSGTAQINTAQNDSGKGRILCFGEPLVISTDVSTEIPSVSESCCRCCGLEKDNSLHRQIKVMIDRQFQQANQDLLNQQLVQERFLRTKAEALLEKHQFSEENSRQDLQKLRSLLDDSNAALFEERERRIRAEAIAEERAAALREQHVRSRSELEALDAQCRNLVATLRELAPLLQQISPRRDDRNFGAASQCAAFSVSDQNIVQRAEAMRLSFRQAHAYACGTGKMLRTLTMPSTTLSVARPNFRWSMRAVNPETKGLEAPIENTALPAECAASVQAGTGVSDSGQRGLGRMPQHRPSFFMDEEEDEESERRQWRSLISRGLYLVFGVTDGDARLGILKSHCIHPASPFYRGVVLVLGVLLVYSALVVPIQLSFWNSQDPCNAIPTLHFDVFVDTFFLIEIIVNCFVGFYAEGVYVDSVPVIAERYITSPTRFWFDMSTSIPFGWIDYAVYMGCHQEQQVGVSQTTPGDTRLLRLVKPLRILKLLRIFRMFKFADCIYWRVKLESSDANAIAAFLDNHNIYDHQCLGDIYALCFYYVFTTFTTVGYGDISAVNTTERVFCVFLFLTGVSLFGTLISQTNSIILALSRDSLDLACHLERYTSFMKHYKVPRNLDQDVRNWVRFQHTIEGHERKRAEVLFDEKLPEVFRLSLAKSVQNDLFSKVTFLDGIPEFIRASFAAEFYSPGSIVADSRQKANRLFIVASGTINIMLPLRSCSKYKGKIIRVLQRGDVFGDSGVVGDERWAGSYGIDADFVARDNCSVMWADILDIQIIVRQLEFNFIRRKIERGRRLREDYESASEEDVKLETVPSSSLMAPILSSCIEPYSLFHWAIFSRELLRRRQESETRERGPSNSWICRLKNQISVSNLSIFSTRQS